MPVRRGRFRVRAGWALMGGDWEEEAVGAKGEGSERCPAMDTRQVLQKGGEAKGKEDRCSLGLGCGRMLLRWRDMAWSQTGARSWMEREGDPLREFV